MLPRPRHLVLLACFKAAILSHSDAADTALFERQNLAAWCIVPFDARQRGPEERAAMLEKLGFRQFVYDYRKEHIPTFDAEMEALKRHHIELTGWWFPGSLNDEARLILDVLKRHGMTQCDLWVTGGGAPTKTPEERAARVQQEVARLKPIALEASKLGVRLGLYNHGSWFGEPENLVALCEELKRGGSANVGIVYNLHHAHDALPRFAEALKRMRPHLICFNLNGMTAGGDQKGEKILPLGQGDLDLQLLRDLVASGYRGPIGILNHTGEDAEGRLQDNLDGLAWLVKQLEGKAPGPKPVPRTWKASPPDTKPKAQAPSSAAAPRLVPSVSPDFGKALGGGIVVPGKAEYRALPLSIECVAQLNSSAHFNILVASDPKASAEHWELYTHAGGGELSLYLPGRGGDFKSSARICDGQWHDLLAQVSETTVTLFVDGKQVLQRDLKPIQGSPKPGDLAFGRLVEGTIGCDGRIDDVRLSRGIVKPAKAMAPRVRQDITLGLWNFEEMPAPANAAASSAPEAKVAPFAPDKEPLHPEDNQHAREFVNRDRVFDYYAKEALHFLKEPAKDALLPAFPGLDGGQQGHWGNQNDQVTWKDGRFAAADLGSLFSTVFKGAGVTVPKGICVQTGEKESVIDPASLPFPFPWSRTFHAAFKEAGQRLPGGLRVRWNERAGVFDPATLSFPVVWSGGFIKLSDTRHGFMGGGMMNGTLIVKESAAPAPPAGVYHGLYRHGKEAVFSYSIAGHPYLATLTGGRQEPAQLAHLTKGGPAQWPQWIETRGTLGNQQPFATDTITIPFENPHGTLCFISGHDFFSDGSAAVATMTGEVWLVRGIDATLEHLRWKRFATGLHQPLGVKIIGDKIHVLGRDQITRLHDLNGDDEADFYECVTNAMITSPGGHDYITGLDADAQGRWYFASGNQGLCRVTAAEPGHGALEVLATGFRNPNGLGLSPDGRFLTTSVQEGEWTPASAICQVEFGRNQGAHFGAGGPRNGIPPERPLLQLPRGEDNSCGGQCFISGDPWSPLKGDGNLIHLSTGSGSAWLVMRQNVKGLWQGAATKLSGNFDSGVQAARFHPRDGQLYITGMQGWGSYTPKDGCFHRLRFTGGKTPVPVAFEARENGVLLRFTEPLEKGIATDASRHFAQCWNYHYSAGYGSPEFSLSHPQQPGHDALPIRSAQLVDPRTLFLEIPLLTPASQIHLHVALTKDASRDLFLTAHQLAEPFTRLAGYRPEPKQMILPAAGAALASSVQSRPNPWAKGDAGREIRIAAALGLQFAQKTIAAKRGERLSLTFTNPDVVPHNFVLLKPDKLKDVGEAANRMITDPQGLARHYVPDSPDVLAYTDMVNPGASFTIHFTAPAQPGSYPYLCTFPGHWLVMNGVMNVE